MLKGMKHRNTNRQDRDTSAGILLDSLITSAKLERSLIEISEGMKNTTRKTIDIFNQKIALCPRLTFSDGVKPVVFGSLFSVGLFSLCCCCGESGLFDISLLFGAKLSFGVSHHRHFGMSSSYSLPHFLQIIRPLSRKNLFVKKIEKNVYATLEKTTRIIASRFKIGGSSFYVSSAFFFLTVSNHCLLSTAYSFIVGACLATGASSPCFLNKCFTSVPNPRRTR